MVRKVYKHKTREQYIQEARQANAQKARQDEISELAMKRHISDTDLRYATDRELQGIINNLVDLRAELQEKYGRSDSFAAVQDIEKRLSNAIDLLSHRRMVKVPDVDRRDAQELERLNRARGPKTISAKEGLAWAEDIGKRIGERVANANR